MTELEEIIQKMINAGESEESIDIVVAEYKSRPEPAKTEAVTEETADVTAVEETVVEETVVEEAVVDTDLESEIISLEQFDLMEPAEKRKLKYGDAQRLLRERSRRDKGGLDSFDVSSNDYTKITSNEKIKLDEEASKQLAEEYNKEDKEASFEITSNQIEERAIKLLKEKTQPSLIESYAAQTARGFASFAKNTAEFANMVDYSVKEAALSAFDNDYEGTPEEKQALMNATKFTGGAGQISYASKKFIEEFLEPSIRKYENQNITDDIENGDYFQAGERAVGAALESIPSVIAASFGVGGFIALGASSAGDKFDQEFSKDPSVSTGVLVTNALATGTIEAGFEMVTRGVLKRSGLLANTGMKVAAADLIRGGTQKILTKFGINAVGEGASEAGTEITKLVLDAAPKWVGGLDREVDLSIGSKEWKNIIDAGIVGSVFGISSTAIGGVKNRNVNAVAAAESILMPQDGKQAVIKSSNKISELFKDRIVADAPGVELLDQAINVEINKIERIKKENSQALGNMNPKEIKAYASNNEKIDKLKSIVNKPNQVDSVKKIAEQDLKAIIETNNVLFGESSNRRLRENIDTVKDQAENIEKLEVKDFANAEDIDVFVKEKGLKIDKKAFGNQGFIYQDANTGEQTIVINREISSKEKAVNVASHEFLHAALFKTLKDNPDTQIALGKSLKATIDNIDLDKVNNSDFAERLEQYSNEKENIKSEEVLTLFSDALATGDIKFNENIFTKIGDVLRRSLQKIGVEIKWDEGRDVYNFVKDYNNRISKGKLNKSQIKAANEGVKGKLVSEAKEITNEINVKESKAADKAKTALEAVKFENIKKTRAQGIIVKELPGMVKAQVFNQYSGLGDQKIQDFTDEVVERIYLAGETEKWDGRGDLYGFINGRIKLRIKDVVFNEYKRDPYSRLYFGEQDGNQFDALEKAANVAVEDVKQVAEKPKYKNLLESKVLSSDVLKGVKGKVLRTVRTLKSRMDAKVSLNKTITPLVSEIKKDMGKQADIDLKKAMGSKKDGQLKNFLVNNKKSILENMTTTWLMGAMPGAIQKQVDGKFTSDWQGKKIDRETVNTNSAGKTSGAEIVRRFPNAAQNISDEVFLGYILDAKGNPIRGRKESLAKALAEEIAFDIFNQQLKNPESDISKAFENNQEAKGVLLLDSYIGQLGKDTERGTVKFSLKVDNIIKDKSSDLLKVLNDMDTSLTRTSLKAALTKVYEGNLSDIEINDFAKASLRSIQKYIKKEEPKEIGFNTFVFEGMQLEESDSNLMKAFGLTSKVFGSFKQLFEIGTNISKQRELSLSYNINLVAKEGKEGLIKLLKYSRGHQTSSGKIGDGRMQIFKGNGDYVNNNLNVIPGVEVVWSTETNRVKSVSYKGEVIADWQKLIKTPPQNANGGKDKFKAEYDYRLKDAREAWTFLTDFLQHVKDEGNVMDWIMTMMSLKSSMASVLKAAAPVKYYFEGKQSGKLRYEHMIPTEYMVLKLTDYYFNGRKFDLNLLRDKYNVAIIPVSMDDKFNIQRQKQMNPNWDPMNDPETNRYYDSGTFGYSDMYAIEVLGGENKGEIIGKDWVKINDKVKPNVAAELDTMRAEQKADNEANKPTVKFSMQLNKDFNDILERTKGIASEANFSRIVAKRRGASIGKFKVWMPSSLNDFKGLTSYTFAGKGRQGDADQKFFKENLIDPYFKGIAAIETSRQTMKDDFVTLNKMFKPVVKSLGTLIESGDYTNDQAIRVYLWTKAGFEVPGLSKRDQKKLLKYIDENPDLKAYADGALLVSKQKDWIKPGAFWDAQTILSDLGNMTEKVGRKNYIAEFIENADIVFSEANLNKIEALYGTRHRDALEDILYRMKNGTNRPAGASKNQNIFNNWVNNSIGAIMFFNRRSALLQTLSTVNFLNWSDNNPVKAAAAFANQPQYWKDFSTIFNSAKLKQRRSGLKSDINEAEIASAVKGSKNKATAALSWLLKKGFLPTQMADSFAIAAGGATFYRNRINTLMKKGMSKTEAEAKAFSDFSEISEETQQSGDPALISSDQASVVGRLLLAFQNTPIQLNRSIKKSAQDIYNRRRMPGQTQVQSDFSNMSKIVYYGAIQNIIFTALSNALFALLPGFDDEEPTEEDAQKLKEKKLARMANGIVDTTLKGGFGLPGAVLATIKNVILEYNKQDAKGFKADHGYTIIQAINLAPPIGSKVGKIYSGIKGKTFNRRIIEKRGFGVKAFDKFSLSPKYSVWGKYIEGTTNLPLGRAVDEINSIVEAFDTRNTVMQRIALGLGWRTWDVNVENEENELIDTIEKGREARNKKSERKKNKDIIKQARNKK